MLQEQHSLLDKKCLKKYLMMKTNAVGFNKAEGLIAFLFRHHFFLEKLGILHSEIILTRSSLVFLLNMML